jgi:hypothetical protein
MKNLMKQFSSFMLMFIMCALVMFTSCNVTKKQTQKQPTPVVNVAYDYDKVVAADYDLIASQYKVFRFLEVDAMFDKMLNDSGDVNVISIRTIFQVGDTCIMIEHPEGCVDSMPIITKENDYWMECGVLSGRNAITLDSCLKLIDQYRPMLPTRRLTFRRLIGPPFPKHGEYIFGNGLLFVDGTTGEMRGEALDNGFTGSFQNSELKLMW